jgi:hypothetical protein
MSDQGFALPRWPAAIKGEYQTIGSDENVDLYSGLLTIGAGDVLVESTGSISLEWQPEPRLAFRMEFEGLASKIRPAPDPRVLASA